MASVTVPRLLTAEEFQQLDEVLGFRDELIEGERVLSPSAVYTHTALIKRIERLLESQLRTLSTEPLEVVREGGWKFQIGSSGADSVPVPDLMVIRVADERRALASGRWFEGIPVLIVEVVSPSERKSRRLQKVGLYLEMGVPHVVEVDYTKRVVLVHNPESDAPAVYGSGDEVTSPFRVRVAEIFAGLDEAQA